MSSNFLQRFKGKTQTISKQGVHNILGGNNKVDVQVYTNSNGIPMSQKANTSKASNMSMNVLKKNDQINNNINNKRQSLPKTQDQFHNNHQTKNSINNISLKVNIKQKQKQSHQINQNPFLISNPFYLDQQQRQREQKQRKQQLKQQRIQLQQTRKLKEDIKKGTSYSSSMSKKNNQTKKIQKQWVKLGGLGANIGGQEWQEKKKKLQKMQQFANQVKVINTQKGKIVKPSIPLGRREQKKDNPRTKALQYSKNVPRPVIKQYQHQQQQTQQPIKQIHQNQMTEMQMYEMKHRQLKEMVKRDF